MHALDLSGGHVRLDREQKRNRRPRQRHAARAGDIELRRWRYHDVTSRSQQVGERVGRVRLSRHIRVAESRHVRREHTDMAGERQNVPDPVGP